MTGDSLDREDLMKKAGQAMANGKPRLAIPILQRILKREPRHVAALYRLGRAELQLGAAKRALGHFAAARAISGKDPNIWSAMVDALIQLGDRNGLAKLMEEAARAGMPKDLRAALDAKAKSGNTGGAARIGAVDPQAFNSLVATYQGGRFAEAIAQADTILAGGSAVAPVLAVKAASQAALGDPQAARSSYEAAIGVDPHYPEARIQLGQLLYRIGEFRPAVDHLAEAKRMLPDAPLVAKFLGLSLADLGQGTQALMHLYKARDAMPDDRELLDATIRVAIETGDHQTAKDLLDGLKAQAPTDPAVQLLDGQLLNEQGQTEAALSCIGDVLTRDPAHVIALNLKAHILANIGQADAARELNDTVLDLEPTNAQAVLFYARSQKIKPGDPKIGAAAAAFDANTLSPPDRVLVGHALAKAAEDTGDHKSAFSYMLAANRTDTDLHPVGDLDSTWDGFRLTKAAVRIAAEPTDTPIRNRSPRLVFVSGMPRSGTTLVESIIAGHSTVTAGDELGLLARQLRDTLEQADATGQPLDRPALERLGDELTESYKRHAGTSPVLTDKAIFTFAYFGMIPRILPDARMILVRRHPLDNCLSMFKNNFRPGKHRYANDLVALGETYLGFLKVVSHWRQTMPDRFTEIRYEDLIADPDTQVRQLVAAAGLDWEDRCMDFHKSNRSVKTLSRFQVRQPIYSSSVGAWKSYESDLAPLIRILEDGGALDEYTN